MFLDYVQGKFPRICKALNAGRKFLIPVSKDGSKELQAVVPPVTLPALPRAKSSSSNLDLLGAGKTALGLDKLSEKQQKKMAKFEETAKNEKKEKGEGNEKGISPKEKEDKLDKGDGLGERIVFVLQVARRAQNWLGYAVDYADQLQA